MTAFRYYTAVLEDDGDIDTDSEIVGHSSYSDARSTAEDVARRGIHRKEQIVILSTQETVWAEPAIKDDRPIAEPPAGSK